MTIVDPKSRKTKMRGGVRKTFGWIFFILLMLSAQNAPQWPGMLLCFIGATIRFWSSWHIQKNLALTVTGPYAYTRNPLYFGSFLMAIGSALAYHAWTTLLFGGVGFFVVYHFVILSEEIKLRHQFGLSYSTFCLLVPRFFPKLLSIPAYKKLSKINSEKAIHLQLVIKNKFYQSYLSFIGLIGFPYIFFLFKQNL